MKKILILTLGLFVAIVGVSSCENEGESEAEIQARLDSLRQDSIDAAERLAAIEDSLAQARLDSIQLVNDSLMNADPEVIYVNTGSNKKDDDKPATTNTNTGTNSGSTTTGKPTKGDRGATDGGKPTKGDRASTTNEGDNKTDGGKPSKSDRRR